jgi:hypothetical protein
MNFWSEQKIENLNHKIFELELGSDKLDIVQSRKTSNNDN